ncbi:ABC transporter ATP-binding protein [Leptolyngbya sp. FACHB-711]|uniref:ABC transporter ATP-binding protein n=1 Tax=unclassified Leptolyngbya TaxID=2650499 RepID=UPI001688D3DB|nr:ABC transporter ATP-binding protein [Leptolyngbya sp. FACHB-711]MBD1851927.1 ABC transporter ATP-binding protein [Cyanobacteria bacterium FACHB-502]MBD2026153.1 ABC transporter ATP-binding protein [Leptolyngbya sp. FACHB-711]
MPKLELIHLNKTYSPKVVPVRDLSLGVDNGEFLTLLGPSGCGKSTTLRMIAGLEQPTRGEIRIADRNVTNKAAGDRNIAMVFQSYALYPHMSVYDNMASGLRLRHMKSDEIRRRIHEVSGFLGLEELMERKPGQLSGGQRQRVALGRALVRQPDVFLLDEPLSNLDALLREQVRAELKEIFTSLNTPIVYVTHDQTEAMTLSTRVAVLNGGILQQLDPPRRIYTHPANRFVAGFIGSPQMNLLDLKCDGRSAVFGNYHIPLPDGFVPPPEITLGIRPEHVHLADSNQHSASTVQGRVVLSENLGMSELITVRVRGAETMIFRALISSDNPFRGEEITLTLPPEHIHWFNTQTGERLPAKVLQSVGDRNHLG